MALNWKPHTQLPEVREVTTIVIATPKDEQVGLPGAIRAIYVVYPNGEIVGERDESVPTSSWFWVFESEVLEGLPCAY